MIFPQFYGNIQLAIAPGQLWQPQAPLPEGMPQWFGSLGIDPVKHWCIVRPKLPGVHPEKAGVEVEVDKAVGRALKLFSGARVADAKLGDAISGIDKVPHEHGNISTEPELASPRRGAGITVKSPTGKSPFKKSGAPRRPASTRRCWYVSPLPIAS